MSDFTPLITLLGAIIPASVMFGVMKGDVKSVRAECNSIRAECGLLRGEIRNLAEVLTELRIDYAKMVGEVSGVHREPR